MPVVNLAASSFFTTGSISASSNSLTVADASGFAVNDYLIIEIGGESGAGLRGTIGVGGVWPDLSYANAAARDADTGQADGQYAYLLDTGDVYRSFSGVWSQTGTGYYTLKKVPRSLAAKITGKAGNVLTLDKTATVTATNANVYFDNFPLFDAHAGDADGTEVVWPTGAFAISDACRINAKSNWHIHGTSKTATRLFFPKGIAEIALIWIFEGSNNVVSDLCVEGNAHDQGYMISWLGGDQTAAKYHYGIYFQNTTAGIARDTKSIDVFQGGVEISNCTNTSAYRHEAVRTVGLLEYIQWQIQGADSTGGEFVDCRVTSPKLTGGIEWFRSSGVSIQNYVGVNASMSMNTANNWLIESPTVTIQANSYVSEAAFSRQNPLIAVTALIGGASIDQGGTISNPILTVQGYINSDNDILVGIIIADDVPNITIRGGSYTGPDYAAPSTLFGPQGCRAEGPNNQVSCFTVYGHMQSGTQTLIRSNVGVDSGAISYSRALSIYGTPGQVTLTGNGLPTDPQNAFCFGGSRTKRHKHVAFNV